MQERPILFSTDMVKAILDGRKTQTRRLVKQPNPFQVGRMLWVRETFYVPNDGSKVVYKASTPEGIEHTWKPSIFMPRKYSRILLEVTNVRVERLNDIKHEGICKEGFKADKHSKFFTMGDKIKIAKMWFHDLWERINGEGSWGLNPFVSVISFKTIRDKKQQGVLL